MRKIKPMVKSHRLRVHETVLLDHHQLRAFLLLDCYLIVQANRKWILDEVPIRKLMMSTTNKEKDYQRRSKEEFGERIRRY